MSNSVIKELLKANTNYDLFITLSKIQKEMQITLSSQPALSEQVRKLVSPKHKLDKTNAKQKFQWILDLNLSHHFSRSDFVELLDDATLIFDDDDLLMFATDNQPLNRVDLLEIMEKCFGSSGFMTSESTSSSADDSDSGPHDPLKGGVWKLIPPYMFMRSLWSHKKPAGLVKQSFCYNQVVHLLKQMPDENWGDARVRLYSYLDYTFRRLLEEGKVMAYWLPYDAAAANTVGVKGKEIPEMNDDEEDEELDILSGSYEEQQETSVSEWVPPVVDVQSNLAACIMVWNTGLYTVHGQEAYCVMVPYIQDGMSTTASEWYLKWFHTSNEFSVRKKFEATLGDKFYEVILKVNPPKDPSKNNIRSTKDLNIPLLQTADLPKKADYFKDAPHYLIQYYRDIEIDYDEANNEHLFHHPERYSPYWLGLLRDKLAFLLRIRAATERAVAQAIRNPRIAVPFYSRSGKTGELQLMLPINLSLDDSQFADCAIVLKVIECGQKKKYQVRTVFSIPLAYNNARLLSEVREPWLVNSLQTPVSGRKAQAFISTNDSITYNKEIDTNDNYVHPDNKDFRPSAIGLYAPKEELYTEYELRETIQTIRSSRIPFNHSALEETTTCKSAQDYAKVIVKMRPNWKLTFCKHRSTSNLHNAKPHICAFAHSEVEKNYWDTLRNNLEINSKDYYQVNQHYGHVSVGGETYAKYPTQF